MDKFIETLDINSFIKNIIKPTEIAMNKTLKKFSLRLNLLVKPTITNDNTTINKGFSNSDK